MAAIVPAQWASKLGRSCNNYKLKPTYSNNDNEFSHKHYSILANSSLKAIE